MNPQAVLRDINVIHRCVNHARRHDKKAKLAKFRATFRKVERGPNP